jgi:hypothetical protein
MTSDASRDHLITGRVTKAEKEQIDSAAQQCGRSTSEYVRDRVLGRGHQRRPITAAAGELLAICHALTGMAPAEADKIRSKARAVIAILADSEELGR